MSDMVARLKLESGEFDSKIKRAAQGIQRMAEECHNAGAELNVLEEENKEYIQSIGRMETVSKTARGSVAELTAAFMDMKHVYNQLSEDEKNGEVGRELNKQLGILKQRINEGNQELKDMQQELNGGLSGALDSIAGKFGINIKQLASWGTALAAGKMALDVAKDAFFASEASVDEWGRTVAASESVYEGFLTAINNGDISGYLSRIDEIVEAARKAYDELDRLGTMKTIQGPQTERQNAENVRLRTMLMTGRYIAPAAGSGLRATMETGTLLSPGQLKSIESMLQNGMKTIVTLTGNELKQTGKAIDAYYNKLAKENGMTMEEFRKGTSSMAEFDKRVNGAKAYEEFEARRRSAEAWARSGHNLSFDQAAMVGATNPYAQYKGWSTFRVDKQGENSYNELVGLIRQQQQQTSAMYSTIGQAYRTINRAEGTTVRDIMNGGGGGKGGNTKAEIVAVSGSIDEQMRLVQELQKAWRAAADDDSRQKIKAEIEEQQYLLDRMTGKENFDPTKMGLIVDLTGRVPTPNFTAGTAPVAPDEIKFSDSLKKYLDYMQKQQSKDEKKEVNLSQEMSKIVGGVSGMMSGLEQLGVELPQGLKDVMGGIQGMISILTSISTIISAIEAISAADTLIPFARGGIVKAAGGTIVGNSYSGDNLRGIGPGGQLYGLNAGEVVLNRAESGILASVLEGGIGNIEMVPIFDGEKCYLMINRWGERSSRGKLVFQKQ